MLQITAQMKILVAIQPVDFRNGIDGLAQLCKETLQQDPFSGHLFLFRSRGGDRLKVLYWDKDGLALWYKRLEEGTFKLPRIAAGATSIELRPSELAMLLDGIDLRSIRRVKRYSRAKA